MNRAVQVLPIAGALLWLSYTIHGFRSFWTPLVEIEGDSGSAVRQALFLGTAALVVACLTLTGRLGATVARQIGFFVLAAWLTGTVLYAEQPVLTAKRSVLFACGIVTLAGATMMSRAPARAFLRGSVAVVALAAWPSLLMWVSMPAAYWQLESRHGLSGITSHPNTLGPCLAIGFVLALGCAARTTGGRVAIHAARYGSALALLLTDSVGSLLVAIVGSVVFVALRTDAYRRGAGLLALVVVVAAFVVDPRGWIDLALGSVGRDASLSGRDQLWEAVGAEFAANPALGVGYGSFWVEGRGRSIVGTWNPRQSHNAWLDLMVDVGLLGLLVFGAVVTVALFRALRRHDQLRGETRSASAAMLAVVIALLAIGSWSESFLLKADKFQFFVLLWILMLLPIEPDAFPPPSRDPALHPLRERFARRMRDEARAVASAGDSELGRIAHRIRGTAAQLGFDDLANMAAELLHALADRGDLASTRDRLAAEMCATDCG